MTPASVQAQISAWKNALLTPEQAAAGSDGDKLQDIAARVYAEYQRSLKAFNALDFDDLILQPVHLLRDHPEVLRALAAALRYLLVDEYQDTNAGQYELVKLLVGDGGALTVVGDDDQSVYAWRGARPENLHQLKGLRNLKVIKLEQNYRCSGRILKAANPLIANNPHLFEKALWSEHGFGDPLKVLACRDDEHEAERVVSELMHHKFLHNTDHRDYAILYRGNHQARLFERCCASSAFLIFSAAGCRFSSARGQGHHGLPQVARQSGQRQRLPARGQHTAPRDRGRHARKLSAYAREWARVLLQASLDAGIEQRLTARQVAILRVFSTG